MIANTDRGGKRHMEFDEFLDLMVRKVPDDHDRADELREAFKVFDKNGDNFISRAELRYALDRVGRNKNS